MRLCACALVVLLSTACGGGDDGGSPDAAPADARPADAPPADAPVTSVTVTGLTIDYVNMNPLAGVSVTLLDHPEVPGVMSNATGAYALPGVPAFTTVTLHFEKLDYMPQVTRQLAIGGVDYAMYDGRGFDAMVSRAAVDLIANILGVPHDPARGAAVVRLEDATNLMGLAGAVATLTPVTGSPAVYFNASQFPDQARTDTSTAGIALFHDYLPGTSVISFTHATRPNCIAAGTDAPAAPLTFEIYPDTITWIPFSCSP